MLLLATVKLAECINLKQIVRY